MRMSDWSSDVCSSDLLFIGAFCWHAPNSDSVASNARAGIRMRGLPDSVAVATSCLVSHCPRAVCRRLVGEVFRFRDRQGFRRGQPTAHQPGMNEYGRQNDDDTEIEAGAKLALLAEQGDRQQDRVHRFEIASEQTRESRPASPRNPRSEARREGKECVNTVRTRG